MKKMLLVSTLAIGLSFAGTGQSSAATIQETGVNSMDIEAALQLVQQERLRLLQERLNPLDSQQLDMLHLQSLSNKRNEAFDTMTKLIKKMQDSRSSILENMR